ncbi:hypothetical protein [Lederbergia ruris]|uniref:hypothetical protein n=1 Tax=Lederbergia ruris TaxID=217495 RepID=UPI0039A114EB
MHAIVKEIYSLSDITKMDDIIDLLSDDMSTNVDQKSLNEIYSNYSNTRNSMDLMELKGDP